MTTYGTADEALLTRAEMARALGKSKTTIRRWEASGKLTPIKDEHGVNLFRVEDARCLTGVAHPELLPKARAFVPSAAAASAELAAQIFDRLDREMHPVDIVKELRAHPDVVDGFVARWSRLRSALFLTPAEVNAIRRATNLLRVRDGNDIVARIEGLKRRNTCDGCEKGRGQYCKPCVRDYAKRMVEASHEDVPKASRRAGVLDGSREQSTNEDLSTNSSERRV